MLRLVDRKDFTKRSVRILGRPNHNDYALEFTVACVPKSLLTYNPFAPWFNRTFIAKIDTGYYGEIAISDRHYEQICQFTPPLKALPDDRPVAPWGTGVLIPKLHKACNFWIYPFPQQPLHASMSSPVQPTAVNLGHGLQIFSGADRKDAVVGMRALRIIKASLRIDYAEEKFTIEVP